MFELDGGVIAQVNSSWTIRVDRNELVEFQVDGTTAAPWPGCATAASSPRNATPKPVWNPDLREDARLPRPLESVPDNDVFDNGFKTQWEEFLRHVVRGRAARLRLPRRRPRASSWPSRAGELATGARVDLPELDVPPRRERPDELP